MTAGLLLAAGLAPMTLAEAPAPKAPPASQPLFPAGGALRLHSQLEAYAITPLSVIPKAPAAKGARCPAPSPQSAPARDLAAAGWHVAQELDFGPYRAVLFAAEAASEGAACLLSDSNLGLFHSGSLQAVVWSAFEEAPALSDMVVVAPGQLRLSGGDFLALPQADLRLEAEGGLLLTALPEAEPVCDGRLSLPLAWEAPLKRARVDLLAAGWQPVTGAASAMAAELAALGLPEGEDCSGAGLQMCSFLYAQAGAGLQVTTFGALEDEGPRIAGYQLDCDRRP